MQGLPVWGGPELELYAYEQEQAATSKTETVTTTALAVIHIQSDACYIGMQNAVGGMRMQLHAVSLYRAIVHIIILCDGRTINTIIIYIV